MVVLGFCVDIVGRPYCAELSVGIGAEILGREVGLGGGDNGVEERFAGF